jgi:predicted dehydrogenase
MIEKSTPSENSKRIPRRTFLAGAGGLGMAALLAREARAAAESAKGTYRVGVIGHTGRGDYGHGLDVVWRDIPQGEMVGVADPDPKGLARAVKRLGASTGYESYRAMFAEAKLDFVSICPDDVSLHLDMVVAAAEGGVRGIYIEKPLCGTLEEADEMVAVCQHHNVKLATAHQTRYLPKLEVIREIIRSGKLGRLLEIRGRCKEDGRGGGLGLWVLGTRVLSVMEALAGDPLSCYATVLQDGEAITREDVRDSEQNGLGPLAGNEVHAMYRFSSGTMGYFDSVRHAGAGGPQRFGVQLFGSEGTLRWTDTELLFSTAHFLPDPLWDPSRSGKEWIPVSSAGIGVPEPLTGENTHHPGNVLAVKDLIAAVEEDRAPLASLAKARTNLEMIVGVFESQRVGGPVTFPLENRKNPLTMI